MVALISFFVLLIISLSLVRIAAVILQLTGIAFDSALFQARSAFTGAGFTTRESEMIVNHPVRRQVISTLMLIGNIGFVTFVSSLVISFLTVQTREAMLKNIAILFVGLVFLWFVSRAKIIGVLLTKITERFLRKWTKIHTYDYDSLLNLSGDYEVITIKIKRESWLAERGLADLRLSDEGILVLAIRRADGHFIGSPRGETMVYENDELIVYGRETSLAKLDQRRRGAEGDLEHRYEIAEQARREGRRVGKKSPTKTRRKTEVKKKKGGIFFGE
ncbi:MAG: TrkA C-terminal domain-containing protein [Spirochaetaceae bacterium]